MQNHYRVLIIDDCLEDRHTYRRYLQNDQKYIYNFLEQEYGQDSLELCFSMRPDIILLDYLLPDMDGLEFLQELKANFNGNMPSVLMLTGAGNEKIAVQAMKYGVEDYLVKGDTTAENLRLAVRNVIEKKLLQQQLEASQRRFFASVENMLDCFGIYVCIRDVYGKIIGFKDEYLNTAAVCEGNLIGLKNYNTEQEQELFKQYCQVIQTGVPLSREVLYFNNNEQSLSKAYDIRISKLEDGFVATWRDITQRKESEQALQQNQQLIQQIADTTPDILYLFDLKEKRNIYVNCQIEKRLGYSPQHIQEMGVDFVQNIIHPDDLQRLKIYHQKFQSVNKDEILQFEYRMRDRQGKWRWFSSRDTVFNKTNDGQPRQLLGVVREITAQKQSEEALRESEARFRHIFESNMIGIMFWKTNGKIVDANTRFLEIIGYSREDLQAESIRWDELTPPEWEEVDREIIEQIRTSGVCHPLEKEYLRKDGSRVPILLGASLLENSSMAICFILDITKRKSIEAERTQLLIREQQARKEAELANRAKDDFIAMVSHDLRSPLNAILGWAQLLQKNGDDQTMRNHALEVITRNARAQNALIKDLLDVSKIIQGHFTLETHPVDLQSIVTKAIETAYPMAMAKNIRLESEIDSTIKNTIGDANRLQQVLGNLLSNAIKFTPELGYIKVSLQQLASIARIKVSDSGKGISSELLPHIFERFRQGNDCGTKQKGLGLGLAIARHLVELHGGTIRAENRQEGKGAIFIVDLPLQAIAFE
ncbi:MAG: PAS domain S-box protein [Nostocales cyanobacterium 94392]|nr:PAS domain S-box protein [Nostocales cyanobacterium 94392]